MEQCTAACRPFGPDGLQVRCEQPQGHPGLHSGHPRQTVTLLCWDETDRRTYHGAWPGCCAASVACVLPEGHRGSHEG